MSARNVSYSLCRLIAVWFFVTSLLPTISTYAIYINSANADEGQAMAAMLIMAVLYLAVICVLWFGADKISSSITRKDDSGVKKDTVVFSEKILINTGLVLLGFYIIIIKIPVLISGIMAYYQIVGLSHTPMGFKMIVDIIANIVSIIIGIILILGKKRIYDVISKLRSVGTDKTQA
jgi:Na+/melibiose symporter-like transporter